jgi:hypothetical protein
VPPVTPPKRLVRRKRAAQTAPKKACPNPATTATTLAKATVKATATHTPGIKFTEQFLQKRAISAGDRPFLLAPETVTG